jgi:DNA-binding NarL/FixJ family response regulator
MSAAANAATGATGAAPTVASTMPVGAPDPFDPSFSLPLVGRTREQAVVARLLEETARGHGGVLLVSGDGGIGKTRLITEATRPARDSKWLVATGRAYALETAIPYAPFADAMEPVLAGMDSSTLTRLSRGDSAVVTVLAPSLVAAAHTDRDGPATAAEQRVRLHASILQFLVRLSERSPLQIVLENLHWADSASLELFHFLARQIHGHRILLVGSWNDTERELPEALGTTVRSLRSLGVARDVHLEPLSATDLLTLLAERFLVDRETVDSFATSLHAATGGNPLFVEQMLRELVERGDLRRAGGVWVGWHVEPVALPRTVRDVLRARLDRLRDDARHVADHVAVIGTAAGHETLAEVTGLGGPRLLAALDELRRDGIIVERADGADVTYDVAHPMLRQALAESVGLARERAMHAAIATAIEHVHGARAERHAESIAAHWQRADPRVNTGHAVQWLLLAGRRATARLARREAAEMLRAALDRADEFPDAIAPDVVPILLDELSRLYRRLGEYQKAIDMCTRARDSAAARGDDIGVAVAERRLGMACEGLGRRLEAMEHFDRGIEHAERGGDATLLTRLHLAKGDCLQKMGRPIDAKREIAVALELAERLDELPLLARAHRALLLLHLWSGPAHRAWAHARSAVELAERSGERNLAWNAHWSAAVLGALTANITSLQRHLTEATRLADELRSPLLQLRTAEIAIELRSGVGEWDRALVDGEKAIAASRGLDQTTLLARLLHWVGGVYLHRGELADAARLFDEAWRVSGADAVDLEQPFDAHGVLPAYGARVSYLNAVGDHRRAIELGADAMAIADRTGYVAWAVYRLLPAIAASAIAANDWDTVKSVRERLSNHAAALAHPIGMAWVSVIDGECALRDGRYPEAITLLQSAVNALEAVPFAFDAAGTRLRLARALQAAGDVEDAVHEARAGLQLLESLGARPAADSARALLRELGARVPSARRQLGLDGLTGRELEIVGYVARRLSNKEIGARLTISSRTVSTHLANIFDKVGVRDRTLLGDIAREQGLHRSR